MVSSAVLTKHWKVSCLVFRVFLPSSWLQGFCWVMHFLWLEGPLVPQKYLLASYKYPPNKGPFRYLVNSQYWTIFRKIRILFQTAFSLAVSASFRRTLCPPQLSWLESFWTVWKDSGHSRKFPDNLESFRKVRKNQDTLKIFYTFWKIFKKKLPDILESFLKSFQTYWNVSGKSGK